MNIWKYIADKTQLKETDNVSVIKNTPEVLLEFFANIISQKIKKKVEIDIYDEFLAGVSEVQDEITLKNRQEFSLDIFSSVGYTKVNRVWNANEYAVLGDVVIFWPKGAQDVVRVSIFDGTIENIALLDVQTRKLIKNVEKYTISQGNNLLRSRIIVGDDFEGRKSFLFFRKHSDLEQYEGVDIGLRPFPGVNSLQVEALVSSYIKQGYEVYTSNESLEYIKGIKKCSESVERGFVLSNIKIAMVSEFEFLGKIDLNQGGKGRKGEEIFSQIVKGDYIVHQDHGIGIYEDLVYQDGKSYLEIHYAGKDRLLVPLTASSKLSKFVGAGRSKPTLTGLNSGVWTRIKNKASEDIEKLAKELIRLYAMRSVIKRDPYIKSAQKIDAIEEFVSTFKHEDTEDQAVITQELVRDLSESKPMDRLIVGDVGFGKTELAARAIFLAVNSNKQAVLLAPTTILSYQHFNVLKERFKSYPFRISLLNRHITGAEREETLRDIKNGKVDIVIGTHTLLSDDVEIPNLALLVIDEEQKFGVSQKERLKNKRMEVDVLSITATPIPRTLNMAISGIRDLSILASVPVGRKPIVNHFSTYNIEQICSAITKEVLRGGQVYYMHNRVKELDTIKATLEERLPNITFGIAHGQKSERQINQVMEEFLNNKINVLICSSIIENGLDIPNVNTIIIDDAQRYGLSSLYQIRGRVGRSEVQAYAYIMYSNLRGRIGLRIDALYEANNIGSGFVLSNRDLEIRGSGNILGKSQSGAINSIGYALYTQILNETVRKLQVKNYS